MLATYLATDIKAAYNKNIQPTEINPVFSLACLPLQLMHLVKPHLRG